MNTPVTLADWRAAYAAGARPAALLGALLARMAPEDPAWIARLDAAGLAAELARLESLDPAQAPLWGIPFAVKDNIDAAGWPTTAACPTFAHTAEADATVVARLRAAGAVLVGKTNLDQFATGLVGTRSPYGAVPNSFDPAYVSGGSSSGSASVVARGLLPFALGTDTAGSGRVPAGFNNIVGLKPTKGWLSTRGLVPACRSLDCISVFALTVADAQAVATIAGGFDAADPYSRENPNSAKVGMPAKPRLAVPAAPEFFGDAQNQAVFEQALGQLGPHGQLDAVLRLAISGRCGGAAPLGARRGLAVHVVGHRERGAQRAIATHAEGAAVAAVFQLPEAGKLRARRVVAAIGRLGFSGLGCLQPLPCDRLFRHGAHRFRRDGLGGRLGSSPIVVAGQALGGIGDAGAGRGFAHDLGQLCLFGRGGLRLRHRGAQAPKGCKQTSQGHASKCHDEGTC